MPRPPWLKQQPKKKYNYIPPPTSGAHIILVSMLKAEREDLMQSFTKQQMLDFCTKYSRSAFKDTNKIWASMKGLIDKSLVGRQISRDPLYYLVHEGRELAEKLIISRSTPNDPQDELSQDNQNASPLSQDIQILAHSSQHSDSNFHSNYRDGHFELKAGTFDIVLVIDQREKIDIRGNLNSVKTELRTLSVGDFIWIARPKRISPHDKTKDLVLDYVVERKRLDDLQSSIFDGRFEQQKLRLLNSGIRRPIYLIEDTPHIRASNLNKGGLLQATINIFIQNGIDVEKVKNSAHANDFLMSMSKCLEKLYSKTDLRSCSQERLKSDEVSQNEFMTFSEFQTKGAKITNWTVREMFAKHLIQITGLSERSVSVIINKYPTLQALIKAYKSCDSIQEKKNLLAKLQILDSNRTIGPVISKRIYACYATPTFFDIDFD